MIYELRLDPGSVASRCSTKVSTSGEGGPNRSPARNPWDTPRMSAAHHVTIGNLTVGNDRPLTLIAGPCALESGAHAQEMAHALTQYTADQFQDAREARRQRP